MTTSLVHTTINEMCQETRGYTDHSRWGLRHHHIVHTTRAFLEQVQPACCWKSSDRVGSIGWPAGNGLSLCNTDPEVTLVKGLRLEPYHSNTKWSFGTDLSWFCAAHLTMKRCRRSPR